MPTRLGLSGISRGSYLTDTVITFSVGEDLLTGLDFSFVNIEAIEFAIANNELIGINFDLISVSEFSVSSNLLAGLDFTLTREQTVYFDLSEDLLTGLNFRLFYDGIQKDFIRFNSTINTQIRSYSFVRRTLRNKVEL